MPNLVPNESSLVQTVNLWETVVMDDSTSIEALVLEVESKLVVPVLPQGLLRGDSMKVGRTCESDMKVHLDKKMSRTHFSIECREDHAIVRDLHSTNGTFVNGMSVSEVRVYDGDQILAGTTIFTVRLLKE